MGVPQAASALQAAALPAAAHLTKNRELRFMNCAKHRFSELQK